jgi:uncharacterized protein (DUF305 family)
LLLFGVVLQLKLAKHHQPPQSPTARFHVMATPSKAEALAVCPATMATHHQQTVSLALPATSTQQHAPVRRWCDDVLNLWMAVNENSMTFTCT